MATAQRAVTANSTDGNGSTGGRGNSTDGRGIYTFEFGRQRLLLPDVHLEPNSSTPRTLQHFPKFLNVSGLGRNQGGPQDALNRHPVPDGGFLNHGIGGEVRRFEVASDPRPAGEHGDRKQTAAERRALVIGIGAKGRTEDYAFFAGALDHN